MNDLNKKIKYLKDFGISLFAKTILKINLTLKYNNYNTQTLFKDI